LTQAFRRGILRYMAKYRNIMREFVAVTKALADETRVRALAALSGRELCLCQLVALLGLAPSTVSKHMSILKQAGLVESRKDGRWVYYRLARDDTPGWVREVIDWARQALRLDATIRDDKKRLEDILKRDVEELCRAQLGK